MTCHLGNGCDHAYAARHWPSLVEVRSKQFPLQRQALIGAPNPTSSQSDVIRSILIGCPVSLPKAIGFKTRRTPSCKLQKEDAVGEFSKTPNRPWLRSVPRVWGFGSSAGEKGSFLLVFGCEPTNNLGIAVGRGGFSAKWCADCVFVPRALERQGATGAISVHLQVPTAL